MDGAEAEAAKYLQTGIHSTFGDSAQTSGPWLWNSMFDGVF